MSQSPKKVTVLKLLTTKSMLSVLSLACLLSSPSTFAKSPYTLEQLPYLQADTIQISRYQPPVANSAEDLKDLDTVLKRVRRTTQDECEKAAEQKLISIHAMFGAALLGTQHLTEDQLEKIENFYSQNLWIPVDYFAYEIKDHYLRLRPFQRSEEIQAHQEQCVPTHPSSSYLSGHSALSRAGALLLGELFPENKSLWIQLSSQAGENRILAGLHHPSDVKDGFRLGEEVFAAVKANADFQKALTELKSSLNEINQP